MGDRRDSKELPDRNPFGSFEAANKKISLERKILHSGARFSAYRGVSLTETYR